MADPLICICLDHLTSDQQRTLEEDLELASRIQNKLLPKKHLSVNGWEIHYVYKPAGIVSGDYIDLVIPSVEDGTLFMLLGDVSGKGIAASMLMSHLHAIFRSLITTGLPLFQLATQANRIFCESTMATHYATLVFARADREGKLEVCNAGHNPPILMQKDAVTRLKATGTPLGMFCESEYTMKEILLSPGDIALFYTDGLTETRNNANTEYGEDRLARLVADFHALSPRELINVCLEDLDRFQAGLKRTDDLTILGIRRLS
jgi:sigma-B regulation protein RsbU (phosphoserine phosphatase)